MVTRTLRNAIHLDALGPLLVEAGAAQVLDTAPAVLQEAAAAAVAQRLATADAVQPEWTLPAPAVTPELLQSARDAIDPVHVHQALEESGFFGQLRNEAVHQALALELAGIAHEAVRFAEAESRPVCPTCIAIGAARMAAEASAFADLRLPSNLGSAAAMAGPSNDAVAQGA